MSITKTYNPLFIVCGLFAIYLILKWTCKFIFGLLDYALLIAAIIAIVAYIKMPAHKKKALHQKVKSFFESINS